jgi:hypothetical protein
MSAEITQFEAWHNKFYGPQGKFNPVRSLARWPVDTGLGYRDATVQAQVCAFEGALELSAFDEAKERALFEVSFGKLYDLELNPVTEEYENQGDEALWCGWKACAKSRAKAAGCE